MGWGVEGVESKTVSCVEVVKRPRAEMKAYPRGKGWQVGAELSAGKQRNLRA